MSLRRRRWSTSADAPFRNERRPLNESRRRRPKHPFVRESMETACNACCRRFFHVGRFLTDDLFPGFMMPSDPAVRSRRPIPPSDPAVRSRRPIRPSDPAARSGRLIRPSDPSRRSFRRSSLHLPDSSLFPAFLPATRPALLRRFSDAPLCTFPMLHDGPRPGCRLFGTVRLFNSYDKLFEKGGTEKSDNLLLKRMTAESSEKSNFVRSNPICRLQNAPPVCLQDDGASVVGCCAERPLPSGSRRQERGVKSALCG